MNRLAVGLAAAITVFAVTEAGSQSQSKDNAVRAGQSVAVTTCISCHVVSRNQPLEPILGHGIPSFEEIANRPNVTINSLTAAMKVARWHDPGMAPTLLPMSHISDTQRAQVAAYILSLRTQP